MKKTYIFAALLGIVLMGSCKEKKQSDVIITKKVETVAKPQGTQRMSDYDWSKVIEWGGSNYSLTIKRMADETLPKCADEQGNEYYDNKITLLVKRDDGSTFFERSFTKSDFSEFTNNAYGKTGALLGLAFDRVEGSNIYFGASVGSPDTMSDEYIPLSVVLSAQGKVTIKKDTQMDTANDNPLPQPKSEEPALDQYEEDGV